MDSSIDREPKRKSSTPNTKTKSAKIVFLGDSGNIRIIIGVGKTSIIHAAMGAPFSQNVRPSVGIDFFKREFEPTPTQKVKAQFWDTAGQERHRSLCALHIRG